MNPQKLDLEAFTAGDHFPGIPLVRVREDGVVPTPALASARLRFIPADRRVLPAVELASADSEITVSGSQWELAVPVQPVPGLTAGLWNYNLETTDAGGTISTFMYGQIRARSAHDPEPSHFTLETITAGDHFPGIPEVVITVNGETPATTVDVAELVFAQPGKAPVILSSVNGKVSLIPVIHSPLGTPENGAVAAFDMTISDAVFDGSYQWNGVWADTYTKKQIFTRDGDTVMIDGSGLMSGSGAAFYGSIDDEDYIWSLHAGNNWEMLFPPVAMETQEERPSPPEVLNWMYYAVTGPASFGNIQYFNFTVGQFCKVGAAEPYSWFQWNGMEWLSVAEGPPAGWLLSIPAQAIPGLTAGKWLAKLRTQDSAGVWKTWFSADQTVLPDC